MLLADDHAVLRAGLRALLAGEPDMEVVGEAENGEEAIRQTDLLRPDVLVLDLAMPRLNGLEVIRQLRGRGIPTKVLVLTMHDEEQYLLQVLRAGGHGYVLKTAADTALERPRRGRGWDRRSPVHQLHDRALLARDVATRQQGELDRESARLAGPPRPR